MDKFYYIPNERKNISITFDDGPCDPTTLIILNMLKEFNIKATFFVLLHNVIKYPKIVNKIISEGHHIGIHSFGHTSLRLLGKNQIHEIIAKGIHTLKTDFGIDVKFFRPPFGTLTPDAECISKEFNLTPTGWNIIEEDWKRKFKSQKSSNIISKTSTGSIIVLHDGYRTLPHNGVTIDVLKYIMPVLLNQEYSFVSLTELIASKSHTPISSFSGVPLLGYHIAHLTYNSALFMYWDVNHTFSDKFFTVMVNGQEFTKPFPSQNAMEQWPLRIEFPLKTITKDTDVFIKENDQWVKLLRS